VTLRAERHSVRGAGWAGDRGSGDPFRDGDRPAISLASVPVRNAPSFRATAAAEVGDHTLNKDPSASSGSVATSPRPLTDPLTFSGAARRSITLYIHMRRALTPGRRGVVAGAANPS
jgi:hypothetical protein